MLFDRLCGIAERGAEAGDPLLVTISGWLREAKLFWWPGKPEDLPQEVAEDRVDFLQENFFLPFRTIAVEDSVSCVLLRDEEEDARGLHTVRAFVECVGCNDEQVLDSREAREDSPEVTQANLAKLREQRYTAG